MSTRSERIKLLIEQSGLSYQELEKVTNIKKSSLQRYASGATPKIPLNVIEKLSAAFHVSQEYLMGWTDNRSESFNLLKDINVDLQLFAQKETSPAEPELSEGEKILLEMFRQIPKEQQKVFLEMGRVYANSLKKG